MKNPLPLLTRILFYPAICLLTAAAPLLGGVRATASLAISPSTIANDYTGALDFTISGLDSAGQTVVVEEFFDMDGSGTITGGDPLLRKFNVTDGQVTSIGGQRNLNIAGDEDSAANAQILTRLLYGTGEIPGRIDGHHIFRISPSGAGFAPFTASLIVTQKDYAGSGISGTVMGGTPEVGQPGALVLLQTTGSDGNLVAITVAGAGGSYSLKTAPGSYSIGAAKNGFVFNVGAAPTITVPSGNFVTNQTATLTASGRTISGTMRDAVSLASVPGVAMEGQSQTGFLSLTLTDASGNYVMDATTDSWKMGFDEMGIARLGFLGLKPTEGSSGNVTGFNIDLPRVTSLIYGSLKTPANVALPFAEVDGGTNGVPNLKSKALTDANGNYSTGAMLGSWRVNATPPSHLVEEQNVVVNTNGSALLQNLVAYPVTAHLRGQIRDNNSNPVGNLTILATDPNNMSGGAGIGARTDADANGNFDLGVFGGGGTATRPWQLQLNVNDTPGQYISTHPTFDVQDGVDINGINYLVYIVTAHLRGQVLDENNVPIGNVGVCAGSNNGIGTGTNTDAGGNFDVGVFGGTWNLCLSNINGLGLIPQDFSTIVTDGVDQNNIIFRARHTTATISGSVMSAASTPIAGVTVSATSTLGGANYLTTSTTDVSGNYSLSVFSSTWDVGVDSNALVAQGYNPVSTQSVFVNSGTVTVNFVASPLASAVSRKIHGGTARDISLPLTGNPGIECRSGGATNDYQIVLTFGQAVTFNNASVSAGTGSVSSTSGSGTSTLAINLTGVVTAQRLTLTLASVNNGTNTFDVAVPMGVLVGDTNGNGAVSASDIGQTKAQSGQTATGANFRTDVNASGSISAADIGLVKSKSGTTLPASASLPPKSGPRTRR